MDKKRKTTDAYVEITVPGPHEDVTAETDVFEGSLNPVWNKSFEFEVVDDSLLQDQTILFTLYDDNKLQQDKTIGSIRVDLNCLLMHGSTLLGDDQKQKQVCGEITDQIEGWFQIYDTLKGPVGELYLSIEVVLLEDQMKYDESATTVQFFAASVLSPEIYAEQQIYGFVEDLVVDKDPEYHWTDSLRSSRVSNEKRLNKMFGLSCSVRRQIGIKAKELGCNAVVGYHQHFDIEGDSGIVSRGSGTACRIRTHEEVRQARLRNQRTQMLGSRLPTHSQSANNVLSNPAVKRGLSSPALMYHTNDILADLTTTADSESPTNRNLLAELDSSNPDTNFEMLPPAAAASGPTEAVVSPQKELKVTFLQRSDGREVKLLTMESFPSSIHFQIGGLVSAYAVKWLGRLRANDEDEETRDGWWLELREEVKGNAAALACSHVVGYKESCSIVGDVCLLSCIGTAVKFVHDGAHGGAVPTWQGGRSVVDLGDPDDSRARSGTGPTRPRFYSEEQIAYDTGGILRPPHSPVLSAATVRTEGGFSMPDILSWNESLQRNAPHFQSCGYCHVPSFKKDSAPFNNMTLFKCQLCEHDRNRAGMDVAALLATDPTAVSPTTSPVLRPQNPNSTPSLSPAGLRKPRHSGAFGFEGLSSAVSDGTGSNSDDRHFRNPSIASAVTARSNAAVAYVPEFILSSIEPPESLPTIGTCHLIEARVARVLPTSARGGRTENCAEKVSMMIPFLLYDLHRQLLLKMRFMQVNTAWALFTQIKIGERLVVGLIRATGVLVPALPLPFIEVTKDDDGDDDDDLFGSSFHTPRSTKQESEADVKARLGLIQADFTERHSKIRPLYDRYYQSSMRLRQSFRRDPIYSTSTGHAPEGQSTTLQQKGSPREAGEVQTSSAKPIAPRSPKTALEVLQAQSSPLPKPDDEVVEPTTATESATATVSAADTSPTAVDADDGEESDSTATTEDFASETAQMLVADVMELVQDTTQEECEEFLSNPATPDGSWMLRTSTLGWPNYLVLTFKFTENNGDRSGSRLERASSSKRKGKGSKRSPLKMERTGSLFDQTASQVHYEHIDICRKVQGYFFSVAHNDPNAFEEQEGSQGNRRRVRWCAERHYKLHEAVLRALRYYGLDRDACVTMSDQPGSVMERPAEMQQLQSQPDLGSTIGGYRTQAQHTYVAKLSVQEGDLIPLLNDKVLPPGITFANAEYLPGSPGFHKNLKLITAMKRMEIKEPQRMASRNGASVRRFAW